MVRGCEAVFRRNGSVALIRLAVLGAAGRMGQTIIRCLEEHDDINLIGAVTEPGDQALGRDAG